jgi:hypothetical protein
MFKAVICTGNHGEANHEDCKTIIHDTSSLGKLLGIFLLAIVFLLAYACLVLYVNYLKQYPDDARPLNTFEIQVISKGRIKGTPRNKSR